MTDSTAQGWQAVTDLPTDLVPTRMLPVDGGVLVCGWLGASDVPPEQRHAVVLHATLDDEPVVLTRYEADGWIASADLDDDGFGHALKISGSEQTVSRSLLYTDNGGRTWVDQGPIGGSSALHVLTLGPSEAWVQGAGALLVTRDSGATWRVLEAPGPRSAFSDRLFRVQDRIVLATPDGAFVTRDGGLTWGRRPLGPVHVRALNGSYIAARAGSETLLGQPQGNEVRWFARIQTPLDPLALRVAAPRVQLLATREDPETGPVMVLVESSDDAVTFASSRLGVPPGPGWATLTDNGDVLAVDPAGQLLVRRWQG